MSHPSLSQAGAATTAPAMPTHRAFKRRSKRLKAWLPYLLVAPAVIYLMLITLYPGIFAILQSFHAVKFGPWTFIGLDNFVRLFGDYQFLGALWNTLVIGSISLTLQCIIALTLAFYA
ncbi:MAG: carbohydrate ABC transporter permease, partial [Geminicoccales bacterium]